MHGRAQKFKEVERRQHRRRQNTTTKPLAMVASHSRFRAAAQSGNLDAVKKLFERHGQSLVNGTQLLTRNTALHMASGSGHLEVVRYLVETCRAAVDAKNADEDTPLHIASQNCRTLVVQYLVEHGGANVHAVNAYGFAPGDIRLKFMSSSAKRTVIEYLESRRQLASGLAASGNVPAPSPLQIAASPVVEHVESKLSLLDEVRQGNLVQVKCLLEHECNVETRDSDGATPLLLAVTKGHSEIAHCLLQMGRANVEAANKYGQTALHIASQNGDLPLVVMLVSDFGASVHTLDNDRKTPVEFATQEGKIEVVSYFESLQRMKQTDQFQVQRDIMTTAMNGNETFAVSEDYVEYIRTDCILGTGFFGTVYKGVDKVLGGTFAIKVLHREILAGGDIEEVRQAKETFRKEQQVSDWSKHILLLNAVLLFHAASSHLRCFRLFHTFVIQTWLPSMHIASPTKFGAVAI
jgi:ankyrin repeat protein